MPELAGEIALQHRSEGVDDDIGRCRREWGQTEQVPGERQAGELTGEQGRPQGLLGTRDA